MSLRCQFSEECPSYSYQCDKVNQDFSRCIPFLTTAIQNARQEISIKKRIIFEQIKELDSRQNHIHSLEVQIDKTTNVCARQEQREVVHGHWIEVTKIVGVTVFRCSACGKEHPMIPSAFCRDCGAKMEEVQ